MAAFLRMSGNAFADNTQDASTTNQAPDGSLSLTGNSVAAGVGRVWGAGKLEFKWQQYPFKISGLSMVDAGIANMSAEGEVYDLKRLSDFGGKYTVTSAGVAVVQGAGAWYLKERPGHGHQAAGIQPRVSRQAGRPGRDDSDEKLTAVPWPPVRAGGHATRPINRQAL
jgi:hypothetical protein